MKIKYKPLNNIISEARRNPDKNVSVNFNEFMTNLLKNFKGDYKNLFISFRNTYNVNDINPHNIHDTPTGYYVYPLISFFSDRTDLLKSFKNNEMTLNKFIDTFPYASTAKFINIIEYNDNSKLLSKYTTKDDLINIYQKLKNDDILKSKVGYENRIDIIDDILENKANTLVYSDIYFMLRKLLKNNSISTICIKNGIYGFIDYDDEANIHPFEPSQGVIFKLKNMSTIKIFDSYTGKYDSEINDKYVSELDSSAYQNLSKKILFKIKNNDLTEIKEQINPKIINRLMDKFFTSDKFEKLISILGSKNINGKNIIKSRLFNAINSISAVKNNALDELIKNNFTDYIKEIINSIKSENDLDYLIRLDLNFNQILIDYIDFEMRVNGLIKSLYSLYKIFKNDILRLNFTIDKTFILFMKKVIKYKDDTSVVSFINDKEFIETLFKFQKSDDLDEYDFKQLEEIKKSLIEL